MQGSLQVGPTLYNQPKDYAQHLRNTGRGHLAKHLEEQLNPGNAATHVSWHAQVPISEDDREAMRKRFALITAQSKSGKSNRRKEAAPRGSALNPGLTPAGSK